MTTLRSIAAVVLKIDHNLRDGLSPYYQALRWRKISEIKYDGINIIWKS